MLQYLCPRLFFLLLSLFTCFLFAFMTIAIYLFTHQSNLPFHLFTTNLSIDLSMFLSIFNSAHLTRPLLALVAPITDHWSLKRAPCLPNCTSRFCLSPSLKSSSYSVSLSLSLSLSLFLSLCLCISLSLPLCFCISLSASRSLSVSL